MSEKRTISPVFLFLNKPPCCKSDMYNFIVSAKSSLSLWSPYSVNFELDLKILNTLLFKKGVPLSLPFIHEDNKLMVFKEWNSKDVLQLNKYGIPQTFIDSKTLVPDIFLVPLLAFDKYGNRLGYGSGYYDKYFNMLNKAKKKFRTIGISFSFQKKDKLKTLKTDFCLDAVFTEKGFLNIQ